MKKAILFSIALTACQYMYAQHVDIFKSRLNALTLQRQSIDDSIRYLSSIIDVITRLEQDHPHTYHTVLTTKSLILKSEVYSTTLPSLLNEGDSITLYDLVDNKYLVRTNTTIGYVPQSVVANTKQLKAYNKLLQRDNKNKKTQNPSTTTQKSYSTGGGHSISGSSHAIQTGPRGGHYYINKNGKKTYVKKK